MIALPWKADDNGGQTADTRWQEGPVESTSTPEIAAPATTVDGSRDGVGAADHDAPYHFGSRPSTRWTYPFTSRQYCHLLILRGRLQNGEYGDDRGV